jgi:exopolysaccharide biosynthesis polyprenyl glycosylphosphotransferase
MLLAADMVGLGLAFLAVEYVWGRHASGNVNRQGEFLLFLMMLPVWVLAAKLYGLYDHDEERTDRSTGEDLVGVFNMISVGAWAFVLGAAVTGLANSTLPKIMVFWGVALVFVPTCRAAARAFCRRRQAYVQKTLVVGAGKVGQLVARKVLHHPEYGLQLVGFVDAKPVTPAPDVEHIPVFGEPDELPQLIERFGIERVIFAYSSDSHDCLLTALRAIRKLDVQTDIVPRLFEVVGPGATLHTLEGLPLVGLPPAALPRSSQLIKRAIDTVLSFIALVALAPLLSLIALLIKLDSPGPVFFRQTRMGAGNRPFRIYKLRTMVADADKHKPQVAHLNSYIANGGDSRMFKAKEDPRTTRVGRVLRRFSVDELPQLANVLKGDMSLVGPRPLVLDEDQHVVDWARGRLSLKPGITGPWQVLGRNEIPFDEMITLDYLYVTNWSLMNDLVLMLRTLPAMARVRDAY